MEYIIFEIFLGFLTTYIITLLSIPKLIVIAQRLRLLDYPGRRSSHKVGIPSVGGIVIFLSIVSSLLLWSSLGEIQFLLLSLLIVFIVGIVDDLVSLSPLKKILGQSIATLNIIYFYNLRIQSFHGVFGIYELPLLPSILFTIFVVVVITNSFNLIDGVDGLASAVGLVSSFFFAVFFYIVNQFDLAMIAFVLSGSLAGFLKYNMHPAKIFMGDSGSLVIGMIFSILAISIIQKGLVIENLSLPNKGPYLAILFLSLPLFDSFRVFIDRIIKGKNPLSAGRDHIHHALLYLKLGHKRTTLTLSFMSLFFILLGIIFVKLNINYSISLLAIIINIFLIIPFLLIKKKNRE